MSRSTSRRTNIHSFIEPLERRQLLSAAATSISYPVTTPTTTATIVRLKTTYHGVAGSSSVTMHIDSFTHTGHFTATLTVVTSTTTITATVTGVVRANRRFTLSYTGTASPGNQSASGTASGKVSPSGKTIAGIVVGTVNGKTDTLGFVLTRK